MVRSGQEGQCGACGCCATVKPSLRVNRTHAIAQRDSMTSTKREKADLTGISISFMARRTVETPDGGGSSG